MRLDDVLIQTSFNNVRRENLTDNSKGNFKGGVFLLFKMASK